MQPLRYSINVTLDGCCDHEAGIPSEALHAHAAEGIAAADALLFGRVIYEMMEEAWRPVAETGERPDWMPEWMVPFARTIHAAKKYVVSDTLKTVGWHAEPVRGPHLEATVRRPKQQPGRGLATRGATPPTAPPQPGPIAAPDTSLHTPRPGPDRSRCRLGRPPDPTGPGRRHRSRFQAGLESASSKMASSC